MHGRKSRAVKGYRERLFAKQKGICWICGKTMKRRSPQPDSDPDFATLDHVIPRSHGGENGIKNLRLAHRVCNTKRGNDVFFKKGDSDS